MDFFNCDILRKIINNVNIQTSVKYIPYGDGEQSYTVFYKNIYPYSLVNRFWNKEFMYKKSTEKKALKKEH